MSTSSLATLRPSRSSCTVEVLFAASLAVSNATAVSHTTVEAGAVIHAGKTANVVARGGTSSEAEAESGAAANGVAGVAFGVQFSKADIRTVVDGEVTAEAQGDYAVKLEIDPTVTDPNAVGYVDYANNRINVGGTGLVTEDMVTYSNRRGRSIGGIRD